MKRKLFSLFHMNFHPIFVEQNCVCLTTGNKSVHHTKLQLRQQHSNQHSSFKFRHPLPQTTSGLHIESGEFLLGFLYKFALGRQPPLRDELFRVLVAFRVTVHHSDVKLHYGPLLNKQVARLEVGITSGKFPIERDRGVEAEGFVDHRAEIGYLGDSVVGGGFLSDDLLDFFEESRFSLGVLRDFIDEPHRRSSGGVAPSDDKVEDHITEVTAVELFAFLLAVFDVERKHVSTINIVLELFQTLVDDFVDVLVEFFDKRRELALLAISKKLLHPPEGVKEAGGIGHLGNIIAPLEPNVFFVSPQRVYIHSERNGANGVKSVSSEKVLKVDDLSRLHGGEVIEDMVGMSEEHTSHMVAERIRTEKVRGNLSLLGPVLSIHGENSVAEGLGKVLLELLALNPSRKVVFAEQMLDMLRNASVQDRNTGTNQVEVGEIIRSHILIKVTMETFLQGLRQRNQISGDWVVSRCGGNPGNNTASPSKKLFKEQDQGTNCQGTQKHDKIHGFC